MNERVSIGAHRRAVIRPGGSAGMLPFIGDGPWSGLAIRLGEQLAVQLELSFLDDDCLVTVCPSPGLDSHEIDLNSGGK